ncbi:ribonuclease H-like domain-containing protein [Lentinula guzmanii]|uniref:Ribonuclease H-like domain-containing protein n=1 Tax=Lentinula guzmanii TaxID=2804957 RepID=A0AA38JD07_9AGAR|nr:ribonuclease H-like domain-containing protein [Lentinula guzmanii]
MSSNPLWKYFHKLDKQNSSHYATRCKFCIQHFQESSAAEFKERLDGADDATKLEIVKEQSKYNLTACHASPNVRGEKHAFIAHLIGNKQVCACQYASKEARLAAKSLRESDGEKEPKPRGLSGMKRKLAELSSPLEPNPMPNPTSTLKEKQSKLNAFNALHMPFSKEETCAVQAQALRAIISTKSPETLFEDPEMLKLLSMLRKEAPKVIPSAKVVGGRLLDDAIESVEKKTKKILKGQKLGLAFQTYTIDIIEATALNKDGEAQAAQFEEMIDRVEEEYDCTVIYFVTDADGGSKKGRVILGKRRPWMILPSCWAHQFQLQLGDYFKVYLFGAQIAEDATFIIGWLNNHGKVRKIFDKAQEDISWDRYNGRVVILAYVSANLTRWTTHYIAFMRLLRVKDALQLAVLQHRGTILNAQVGAAKYSEKIRLEAEANRACDLIADQDRSYSFWSGLESVVGDIEPICYGTNINQKDSTRADQVLLSIAGIYLHFADHPERELSSNMVKRIEKRWKDCDQPLFITALILNPFEGLSAFGPRADLNGFKISNLIVRLYRRLKSHPGNDDSQAAQTEKERQLSKAVLHYLSGTGSFADWKAERADFEETMGQDPITVWKAYEGVAEIKELVELALLILKIVVNQAGCERLFSLLGIIQTARRNRMKNTKLKKVAKVSIRSDNFALGLVKERTKRENHKSDEAHSKLLAVPRYANLLEDMDDEDETERGRGLISTPEGWRTVMAKWIHDAQQAEQHEEEENSLDNEPLEPANIFALEAHVLSARSSKPYCNTLANLFGGLPKRKQVPMAIVDEEAELMHALAEAAEDVILDDGAIEIDSADEYIE